MLSQRIEVMVVLKVVLAAWIAESLDDVSARPQTENTRKEGHESMTHTTLVELCHSFIMLST